MSLKCFDNLNLEHETLKYSELQKLEPNDLIAQRRSSTLQTQAKKNAKK